MLDIRNEEVYELFGDSAILRLLRSSVNTVGELADNLKKDGSKDMLSGSMKINGKKYLDPKENVNFKEIEINREFSFVSWGRKKLQVVQWM